MYKIRNVMSGNLSLDLENGSITLASGQSFDLESRCSRKWINNASTIKRLIAQQYLQLIHDSAVVLPKPVARTAVRAVAAQAVEPVIITSAAVQVPEIVDLSAVTPAVAEPVPEPVKKVAPVIVTLPEEKKEEKVEEKKPSFGWSGKKEKKEKKDSSTKKYKKSDYDKKDDVD